MKTVALFIFIMSFSFISNGQSYAIIKDTDGFVNVRKHKSSQSAVIDKIYDNTVFDYADEDYESKTNWIRIFKQDSTDESGGYVGYVHRSRITPLSTFKAVRSVKVFKDSCVCRNDSLRVIVKSSKFDPKGHKLTFNDRQLEKIDGGHIWGTDGTIPKKTISFLKITKNGRPVLIPESAFKNIFEPQFKSLRIFISSNNIIYIEMDNSDGDGAYTIIWTIKDGKYLKRFIESTV